MTIALIDADIVAYRCAASAENGPEEIALLRTEKLMQDILNETNSGMYLGFLTGIDNFRYDIYPEYKAHRKDTVKPRHLDACNLFLIDCWNAQVTQGYEADDALGMNQIEGTVICSIDKDLLMIPGQHYNFVKKEWAVVSELSGLEHFYKQALIGDTADNIKGVKGIGKVKADKLLLPCESEKDMYNVCCNLYKDVDRLDTNLDCLWIWRNHNERWSDRFAF